MKPLRASNPLFADPEGCWRLYGLKHIAGVDEAGRGPLAGPVVAAAVILAANTRIPGLKDSKLLSPEQRLALDNTIRAEALDFAVSAVNAREIERLGILKASIKAMVQAVQKLNLIPEMLLVDGNQPLPLIYPQHPVIHGDARCPSIAAASVLAKVHRDRLMMDYHRQFPQYNFARHKGYATPEHLEALRIWGPCSLHRRNFKGVKELLSPS